MSKTIIALIAATAIMVPCAQAEDKAITVDIVYDSSLLATEAGAKKVLNAIKKQAKEACAYEAPITSTPIIDRSCATDLVEKAIVEISLAAADQGQATSYVFAEVETGAIAK